MQDGLRAETNIANILFDHIYFMLGEFYFTPTLPPPKNNPKVIYLQKFVQLINFK